MNVYILKVKGLDTYKIGKANWIDIRTNEVQYPIPVRIELLAYGGLYESESHAYKIETKIKRELKPYKIKGEWFDVSPEIIQEIISRYKFTMNNKYRIKFTPKDDVGSPDTFKLPDVKDIGYLHEMIETYEIKCELAQFKSDYDTWRGYIDRLKKYILDIEAAQKKEIQDIISDYKMLFWRANNEEKPKILKVIEGYEVMLL